MGLRVRARFPLKNSHSAWPRTGTAPDCLGGHWSWGGLAAQAWSDGDSGRSNPPSRHTQRAAPDFGFHS